ncbi:MAG TPA: serine/threonine-protein kinase [Gemmatales bacterium]|nr:serine/threonine-protein kinase [Gemmatales bacterium]
MNDTPPTQTVSPPSGAAGANTSGAASPGAQAATLDLGISAEPAGTVQADAPPGYQLEAEVARGGMGVIYQARDLAMNRTVAVKLLQDRFPVESPGAKRFVEEAQITGQLQHPGIPPIYQVGKLADGRPYLAMKLIKGQTLDALLKANTPFNKLAVFEAVAQAVGYAHAHGVIHRDLKPANIMVGAFGEVQVMDWGLAKLLTTSGGHQSDAEAQASPTTTFYDPRAAAADSHTQAGSILGTPAYMAPEQAVGEIDKIGLRTDVFGLGAVLCAVLTGKPPYVGKDAETVRVAAMRGQTDEAFARLDASGAEPDVIALCKRCLAFEPADRPADGNAVAVEVARLRAEAEERARQAEIEEARARVFAEEQRKRRRVVQMAGLAIALVLSAGLSASLWQMSIARSERDAKEEALLSESRAKEQAEKNLHEANANLTFAKKTNEILASVFGALDPRARYTTVAELRNALHDNLHRAVKELEGTAIGDPLTVAQMQDALGLSLLGLGDPQQAATVLEKARHARMATLGPGHPDSLSNMDNLARCYAALGRHAEALALREETLKLRRATLGHDHFDTLRSMFAVALSFADLGRPGDALAMQEEAIKLWRAKTGPNDPELLRGMTGLANSYFALGRHAEALALEEGLLSLWREKYGLDHMETIISMNNLAVTYNVLGRHAEALPLHQEALKRYQELLGPDHLSTLRSMGNLANSYFNLGRHAESLALREQTLQLYRNKLGPSHPSTLGAMSNLANSYAALGRHAEALAVREETLKRQTEMLGRGHPDTLRSMRNLADSYDDLGRQVEALALYEEALKLQTEKLGPDHPSTVQTVLNLAHATRGALKLDRACELWSELLQSYGRTFGPNDLRTIDAQNHLGLTLLMKGDFAEAERHLRASSEALNRSKDPPVSWRVGYALRLLCLYTEWDKPEEMSECQSAFEEIPGDWGGWLDQLGMQMARTSHFRASAKMYRSLLKHKEQRERNHWTTFNTMSLLGGALLGQARSISGAGAKAELHAEAEQLLVKAFEGIKARLASPGDNPQIVIAQMQCLAEAVDRLIALYAALEKPDEVKKWQAEKGNLERS